jgi:hypothetical protein
MCESEIAEIHRHKTQKMGSHSPPRRVRTQTIEKRMITWGLQLSLLVYLIPAAIAQSSSCDQCRFGADDDTSACKVYGQIDGTLVPWTRASRDCLDVYSIQIATVDPATVGCTTTTDDDPAANVNAFVNAIRFETLPNSVRAGFGLDFFVQDSTRTSTYYVLNDSITVVGTTYDCQASENDCYNTALKTYFATDDEGRAEMADVCGTVQAKAFVDRELEQSTVRIRLCQEELSSSSSSTASDNTSSSSACQALAVEVAAKMAEFPDQDCSGFGLGPVTAIPGCSDEDDDDNKASPNTSNATSGTTMTMGSSVSSFWSAVVLYLVPLCCTYQRWR